MLFCLSWNYPENLRKLAWQFHLKNISESKLTKQNLPVFCSCAVNSLNLINAWNKKKSALGQMKPFTCNEIIQFLILAGKNKSSNRNGSKQIPTTLCPNFSISWPSERWINHSDTLEDNSHIASFMVISSYP